METLKLKPYQHDIINHIATTPRCGVWSPMGAGKTVSTLTALENLSLIEDIYPILILAPLRVAQTVWPQEVAKWPHLNHLRVSPILGSAKQRIKALNTPADIYTMNYEGLSWLQDVLPTWPFRAVVTDEATKLKSFRIRGGSKRAMALGKHAREFGRFIELSGTPAPNGLLDLWGQVWFLDYGQRLGRSISQFRETWFRAGYDGFSYEPREGAEDAIYGKLRDLCVTITPPYDLAEPVRTTISVDLPGPARKQYKEMERELFLEIREHTITAENAAVKSLRLLQIAGGTLYGEDKERIHVHSAKLDALDSIVAEAAGAPVLVAYNFVAELEEILRRIPGSRALDKNPRTVDDWNAGKIPVLCAHPASAGHGLNLQYGGHRLVYFSHGWSLENRMQILERQGPLRQKQAGFDRPVFVYDIVARDTLDEDVIERLGTKRSVQDALLNAMRRRTNG